MPSLNKIVLIGRLTRDPEQRTSTSGLTISTFTIAVDRQYKDSQSGERKTDFFRCKAFRQTADFIGQYVTKGRLVAVDGRVEINEVVGQDGAKRYFTDVVCDRVELLESREAAGGGGGYDDNEGDSYQAAAPRPAPKPQPRDDDNGYFDDDEEPAPRAARAAAPGSAQRPGSQSGSRAQTGARRIELPRRRFRRQRPVRRRINRPNKANRASGSPFQHNRRESRTFSPHPLPQGEGTMR